ncbi:unnamed protein product [Pleuronectes platessa]|uniref:Uncharacterized protein n=1 Tax=Pleuronectes platessa TaxID=8262 RepID=A0A9N7YLN3_PLEPL|nr:unnamed protein product [Pleuronectes platessa]
MRITGQKKLPGLRGGKDTELIHIRRVFNELRPSETLLLLLLLRARSQWMRGMSSRAPSLSAASAAAAAEAAPPWRQREAPRIKVCGRSQFFPQDNPPVQPRSPGGGRQTRALSLETPLDCAKITGQQSHASSSHSIILCEAASNLKVLQAAVLTHRDLADQLVKRRKTLSLLTPAPQLHGIGELHLQAGSLDTQQSFDAYKLCLKMLCASWEAQRLAGDQRSGDIALQMAQRGQRKRAVQAQLGAREAGLPVGQLAGSDVCESLISAQEPSVIPSLTLAVTAAATWMAQKASSTVSENE